MSINLYYTQKVRGFQQAHVEYFQEKAVLRRFLTGNEGKKRKRRKTNLKKDRHWVLFLN